MKINIHDYKYLATFLMSIIVLILLMQGIKLNADTMFPFRYAEYILSNEPYAIMVQPGPRFFPDVFYAALSLLITDQVSKQVQITIILNVVVLCASVFYLFSILFKESKLRYIFSCCFCLFVPLLYVLKFGSLRINLFATGVHGFAIPYQIIIIALTIKLIQEKNLSSWGWLSFFIIGSVCGINDSLFLVSTILPVCFAYSIIWLINQNYRNHKSAVIFLFINMLIVIVTLMSNKVLNSLFDQIHFMSTTSQYFESEFLTWVNQKAKVFFDQFFNNEKTQWASYFVLVSIIISLIRIFKYKNDHSDGISTKILFLNIINVTWLPIALFSMWAIDKGLVRYIPYILLISPVIILVNFYKYFQKNHNKIIMVQFIIIFSFVLQYSIKNRKYRLVKEPNNYYKLMHRLTELKDQGLISENGLSDYWVSWSGTSKYGLNINAINDVGYPYVFVSDALAYWKKESDNTLLKKKYTFVVSKSKKGSNWTIDENQMVKNYGQFSMAIPFSAKKKNFLIYVYPNGINSDFLYNGANQIVNSYFTSFNQ